MSLNKIKIIFCRLIFLCALISCSGIRVLESDDVSSLYNEKFLIKINFIKENYRLGKIEEALKGLKKIKEEALFPSEKALRRNLIGVILFSQEQYERAIFNFDIALSTSRLDRSLTAQIYLNLSSSYYKLGLAEKAYSTLVTFDISALSAKEAKKYHKLVYELSKELGKNETKIISLFKFLADKKSLSALKSDPLFENLVTSFFKLDQREKLEIVENFESSKSLCVGFIAFLEVEKLYYRGEKSEASDLLEWIEKNFGSNKEIDKLIKNFSLRTEKYNKLDPNAIGIVLPLSGKKKEYAKRTLYGIDSAFIEVENGQENGQENIKKYNLFIKDSAGSGAVGAYRVKELIEQRFVSVIIGGLFSDEAEKEYLEAKKHGVVFISLSQIFLPKEQKNHLLIEVPGSVESLISRLFEEKMLDHFGRNVAIIYPQTNRGNAYLDEFWRQSQERGVSVTGVLSFDKNRTDHRNTIRKLLGLKFTRERQEELDLLTEIHSLESSKSIRRKQTLKPQIDFDWLFLPAFPSETLQLVPSFSYFDAFKLKIFGGPSWRSQALSKESYKLGELFFVGENVDLAIEEFSARFFARYKQNHGLIEMRASDAFMITHSILKNYQSDSRLDLDHEVRGIENMSGVTGAWSLKSGVWLKDMVTLKMSKGKIVNVFDEAGSL